MKFNPVGASARAAIAIPIVALCSPSIAQEEMARRITLTHRAAPAARVLKALSEAAGLTIECTPEVGKDVLVIDVRDVPLGELLDRIALAVGAERKNDGKTQRLTRSDALIAKQRREHVAMRQEDIRGRLEALRSQIEKEAPFDAEAARLLGLEVEAYLQQAKSSGGRDMNYQRMDALGGKFPVSRFARRVVAAMDPGTLAAIEGPGQVAFSSSPNRMQLPLPASTMKEVAQLKSELAVFEKAVPNRPAADQNVPLTYSLESILRRPTVEDEEAAKVIAVARAWSSSSGFSFMVFVRNAAGKTIYRATCSLESTAMQAFGNPAPALPNERPVELSPTSKEFVDTVLPLFRGGDDQDVKLSPGLREFLLHPDEHDIGELALSDGLFAMARAKGLNLVASPSDMMSFAAAFSFAAGTTTPSQFATLLASRPLNAVFDESGGFLMVRPKDAYEARNQRADRTAMGRLVRAAAAKDALTLDELCEFAIQSPLNVNESIVMPYLMFISREAARSLERENWDYVRLHGSLGIAHRRALESGAAIPFAQLPPSTRAIAERMIFDPTSGLSIRNRNPRPGVSFPYDDFGYLTSEYLPNGVPPETALRMEARTGARIFGRGTNEQSPTSQEWEPASLAYWLYARENPNPNFPQPQSVISEFRCATVKTYSYSLDVTPDVSYVADLRDVGPKSAPVTSPDKLPADVWAQVLAELEKTRERNRKPPPD